MFLVSFEEGNQIEKHKSSGETCVWTEKKVKQNNTFFKPDEEENLVQFEVMANVNRRVVKHVT